MAMRARRQRRRQTGVGVILPLMAAYAAGKVAKSAIRKRRRHRTQE